MRQQPAIYLLTDKHHGTLYTGITNNLTQRIQKHRRHAVAGFTKRYDANLLVYYELFHTMGSAVNRRKELKHISRTKKVRLVESVNPEWTDLYLNLLE